MTEKHDTPLDSEIEFPAESVEQQARQPVWSERLVPYVLAALTVAVLVFLAGCASPRTASITNGQVNNITSAEATTLVKQNNRTQRANNLMQNAPPIFRLTAQPGQKIEISGVDTLEVNVPINQELIMADQPDVTSENVQMVREVRGLARETLVPLTVVGAALSDRKNARAADLERARIEAQEREAQNAAQSDLVRRILDKEPLILRGTDIERVD